MMKKIIYVSLLLLTFKLSAQSDEVLVKNTILNYINGTSYNKTNLIEKAFHKESNLYLDKGKGEMNIVPIAEYISWFKRGKPNTFNGRIGRIISTDIFENTAMVKAEIIIPKKSVEYIDLFLLKKLKDGWKIISKTAASKASNKNGNRILFIVSNAHYYGDSELKTGNSFAEIVNAYDTFINAGYTVDFVSPEGGAIPLAYINTSSALEKQYLYNKDFMYALNHTNTPQVLDAKNYKAVHYIGGGSAMFGVPENKAIQQLAMDVYEKHNGIISSVCHGTAGIVHLKTKDGKYLVSKKRVNGYPDMYENKTRAYFKEFPFLITKTIEERGGIFKYSPRNKVHVEVDGNLITGQNYLSSKHVALKIIEKLSN